MKSSTKIVLALLIVLCSAMCIALFFMSNRSTMLVIYNPVSKTTKQIKVETGKQLKDYVMADEVPEYEFYNYYFATDFVKQVDINQSIISNTTIVLGYIQTVDDIKNCSNCVVGVSYIGDLSEKNLNMLLNQNYKYLNLSQATIIGDFSANNTSLQTLILPQGNISGINNYIELQTVHTLGNTTLNNCFNNCPKLKNINLQNCAEIVNCFNDCTSLKDVTFPQTLETIENSFVNTFLLNIKSLSSSFIVKNGILYSQSGDQLSVVKVVDQLENVTLNGNITKIEDKAFYGHNNLKTLTINAKVSSIGNGAFENSSVKQVDILQNNVLSIGSNSFKNCSSLEIVNLGQGIENIGDYAFYSTKISSLNFETSVLANISQYAFANCKNLVSVKFADRQIKLAQGTFCDCYNLETIYNLNTKKILERAFANCYSLKELINFSGVETVGNYSFLNCKSLIDITEVATITSAEIGAFEGCESLEQARFLNLESISKNMFKNCYNLTDFGTSQKVLEFNYTAFDGCNKLANINFVSDLFVCENAVIFNSDKTSLLYYPPAKEQTTFDIPSTVKNVNAKYLAQNLYLQQISSSSEYFTCSDGVLFSADGKILICYPSANTQTDYTVPQTVEKILSYAFANNQNLTSLTILENVSTIENGILWQNSNLINLNVAFLGENINDTQSGFLGWFFGATSYEQNNRYVPSSLKNVVVSVQTTFASNCFFDCSNLLTVSLAKSGIATNYMFYACYSLQSVTLGNELLNIGAYAFYNCKNLLNLKVVYNANLTSANIEDSAFINTPKNVKVSIYNPEQLSLNQNNSFGACFKDKQHEWAWISTTKKFL